MKFVDNQSILAADNYEVGNTYGVVIFFKDQTILVAESLDEDAIETIKKYLQETNNPRSMKIDNCIRRRKLSTTTFF